MIAFGRPADTSGAASQLPHPLDALTARPGPLARAGLDAGVRDERTGHPVVDGRAVRIDWPALGDGTVIVTRGDQERFMFPVIPPQTAPSPARGATAPAVRDGDDAGAERILTGAGVTPTGRRRVPPGAAPW